MAEIRGECPAQFAAVREALAESLDKDDVGASVAVFVDGEPVVDIWGGFTDAARTIPWQRDTITCVWSTTKTMVALCMLILADRGQVDLAAPVARYWPEFAAAGKDGVQLRHVLAHTAGLPDFDAPLTTADLYDWPAVTARLAAQPLRWAPGTAAGYHSLTQGFVLGEVIRRVTGRLPGTFFAQEVAGPLGADFHIGLPAEHDHRVAPLIAPPDMAAGAGIRVSDGTSQAWRRAQIPAASGFGNARSVAAVQSVLACGGTVTGLRLLSAAGCEPARQEQYRGLDQVLGTAMRWGMGYGMFDDSVGWGGWGGSLVLVHPDTRMAVAYVMNRMLDQGQGDYRGLGILMAAYP